MQNHQPSLSRFIVRSVYPHVVMRNIFHKNRNVVDPISYTNTYILIYVYLILYIKINSYTSNFITDQMHAAIYNLCMCIYIYIFFFDRTTYRDTFTYLFMGKYVFHLSGQSDPSVIDTFPHV